MVVVENVVAVLKVLPVIITIKYGNYYLCRNSQIYIPTWCITLYICRVWCPLASAATSASDGV